MENVPPLDIFHRSHHIHIRKKVIIVVCIRSSCVVITVDPFEFGPQHHGLKFVQAAVKTENLVVIGLTAAMVPQNPQLLGNLCIIRNNHAAVSATTEVLARKKTETTRIA